MHNLFSSSLLLVMLVLGSNSTAILTAQSTSGMYFEEGVVLNENAQEIYFSNEKSVVEGADLKSGTKKWTSKIIGKPILLIQNDLYVLLNNEGDNSTLNLVILDVSNKGKETAALTVTLKNKNTHRDGRLSFMPYNVGNDHFLVWNYHPPLRGADIKQNMDQRAKGAFHVRNRSFKAMDMKDLPKGYAINPVVVSKNDKIDKEEGQQFYSRDKRHILISNFKSKPGVIKNYLWKVYDRKTKKILGMLESNVSYRPFVVEGPHLIYVQKPYAITNKNKVSSFPRQLVWHDLKNNKTIQSIEILDIREKGSTPP